MKKILLALTLLSNVCFGQNKKEQIEILGNRVDSLKSICFETRNKLVAANKIIDSSKVKINELSSQCRRLEDEKENISQENILLQEKNAELQSKLQSVERNLTVTNDTISLLRNKVNKMSYPEFNLISSNKRQSPVTRIPFIADYKIELLIGNTIIDVFEDFGYAYISDDKTYIEISTDAGSNRSYWFELDEFGQLIVTKHYSFSDMDIDEDTWRKTYKNINNWKLISCKGVCK